MITENGKQFMIKLAMNGRELLDVMKSLDSRVAVPHAVKNLFNRNNSPSSVAWRKILKSEWNSIHNCHDNKINRGFGGLDKIRADAARKEFIAKNYERIF